MATMPRQVYPNMIFLLQDCIFIYTILTIMTSQMVILRKMAILKNCSKFFHNSIHIIGYWQVQFFGNHTHVSRTKNDFPLQDCILPYFDPYDVTNGHFSQKGHPQKLAKLFSQLPIYIRMLRGATLWRPCALKENK